MNKQTILDRDLELVEDVVTIGPRILRFLWSSSCPITLSVSKDDRDLLFDIVVDKDERGWFLDIHSKVPNRVITFSTGPSTWPNSDPDYEPEGGWTWSNWIDRYNKIIRSIEPNDVNAKPIPYFRIKCSNITVMIGHCPGLHDLSFIESCKSIEILTSDIGIDKSGYQGSYTFNLGEMQLSSDAPQIMVSQNDPGVQIHFSGNPSPSFPFISFYDGNPKPTADFQYMAAVMHSITTSQH